MDTRVWGPHGWKLIHTVAFNYPEHPTDDDKARYTSFFHSLADVLPCETCRQHFGDLLKEYPVTKGLKSREAMSRWSVEAHNKVNRRLKKPVVSYETARKEYEAIRGKTCVKPKAERCAPLVKSSSECRVPRITPAVVFLFALLVALGVAIVVAYKACSKACVPSGVRLKAS